MVEERFYCRYEGDNIQRHLEKSRAGRESKLNITSRLNWAMRIERKGESEKKRRVCRQRRPGERGKRGSVKIAHGQNIRVLQKSEAGGGMPMAREV